MDGVREEMKIEDYHAMLREMPSIVSGIRGVAIHHCIGPSITERIGVRGFKKRSCWLVLPITPDEHQNGPNALHKGVETWERLHGATEAELLDRLIGITGLDVWQLAKEEAESSRSNRRYKKPSKINQRREV